MTYNSAMPQDVFVRFAQNNAAYTVARDLGTNSNLNSWNLSGSINFDRNSPFQPGLNQGSYLEVLDAAGKIITRFYLGWVYFQGGVILFIGVYGNTAIIERKGPAGSVIEKGKFFGNHSQFRLVLLTVK